MGPKKNLGWRLAGEWRKGFSGPDPSPAQMHQGFCQALARWQDRDEEHGRSGQPPEFTMGTLGLASLHRKYRSRSLGSSEQFPTVPWHKRYYSKYTVPIYNIIYVYIYISLSISIYLNIRRRYILKYTRYILKEKRRKYTLKYTRYI